MSVLVGINIASRHVHGIVRQPLILSVPLLVIQAKKKFVIFHARYMQIPRTLTNCSKGSELMSGVILVLWMSSFPFIFSSADRWGCLITAASC